MITKALLLTPPPPPPLVMVLVVVLVPVFRFPCLKVALGEGDVSSSQVFGVRKTERLFIERHLGFALGVREVSEA